MKGETRLRGLCQILFILGDLGRLFVDFADFDLSDCHLPPSVFISSSGETIGDAALVSCYRYGQAG
jgi:hypothetical protein